MKARLQCRPDGKPLCMCVVIPADIIDPFITDGAEEIEFELIRMPSGVHIEIDEAVLHD